MHAAPQDTRWGCGGAGLPLAGAGESAHAVRGMNTPVPPRRFAGGGTGHGGAGGNAE